MKLNIMAVPMLIACVILAGCGGDSDDSLDLSTLIDAISVELPKNDAASGDVATTEDAEQGSDSAIDNAQQGETIECDYPVDDWGYKDNCDGTVTDTNSGLTWQRDMTTTALIIDDAKRYCNFMGLGNDGNGGLLDDWRIPTIDELRSLVIGCDSSDFGGSCPVGSTCIQSSCITDACNGCEQNAGPVPNPQHPEKGQYLSAMFTGNQLLSLSATTVQKESSTHPDRWFQIAYYDARIDTAPPSRQMSNTYIRCVRGSNASIPSFVH